MTARHRSRLASTAVALGAIAAAALTALAAGPADAQTAGPKPREIKALHYGDTLFEFFQDKHFEALTGLMVSQHFQRVAPHDDDAELLRGGLLLSYGLHKEAGALFARLIDQNAAPAVRDRAWYFLAKIRFQRGLAAEAEEALARIAAPLPEPLEEDRALLTAQLLMARADYAGAAQLLSSLPPKMREASSYARFNLGVALVKSGDDKAAAQGQALLDQIGQAPAPNEEQRALRDRANVALGFAALQGKAPADSRRYLQRVRLEGASSNKALLGFGWAAAEMGEPKAALVPWTELATRSVTDPAVLEARIAVPYAYGELGANAQALERYEQAVGGFEAERRALDGSIAAIREGKLVEGLLATNPRAGMGWFGSLDKLPAPLPQGGHLTGVLAGHEFQEAFKNLRDLIFLGNNLDGWRERLVIYGDMLANRRQAFAERVPKIRAASGAANLPAVVARRDALAAEVAKAETEVDVTTFVEPKQRDLLERVQRGQATLDKLGPDADRDPELAVAKERLRRVAGALTWQLTQQYPDKLWQAKKALKTADTNLAEAQARDAALLKAQDDEPKRFERFAERIAALEQRIAGLVPRVAALKAEQQAVLQGIAVAELEAQKERLDVYATQARLAIAQLLDRAQIAQRNPDAAPIDGRSTRPATPRAETRQ